MIIKIEVNQLFTTIRDGGSTYRIVSVGDIGQYSRCVDTEDPTGFVYDFRIVAPNGLTDIGGWKLVKSINEKVIPDMPLDPSLPILMAGHLQDRQRKKYRSDKNAS